MQKIVLYWIMAILTIILVDQMITPDISAKGAERWYNLVYLLLGYGIRSTYNDRN